jgi:hypothetical protein
VRAAHPDSRRGGHLQTAGSQPIVSLDGLPNLRLPEAPGIRNAPTLRHQPDDADTPPAQFHLPTTRIAPTAHSTSDHQSKHRRRGQRPTSRPTTFGAKTCSAGSFTSTRSQPDQGRIEFLAPSGYDGFIDGLATSGLSAAERKVHIAAMEENGTISIIEVFMARRSSPRANSRNVGEVPALPDRLGARPPGRRVPPH